MHSAQNGMTAGELARRAKVNVETLRYYERRGILGRPRRSRAGWRRYDSSSLRTVLFVKRAQGLGFSLDEIADLLALKASSSAGACARVRQRAVAKVEELDAKLKDLSKMRSALVGLAKRCAPDGSAECPLLTALVDLDEEV